MHAHAAAKDSGGTRPPKRVSARRGQRGTSPDGPARFRYLYTIIYLDVNGYLHVRGVIMVWQLVFLFARCPLEPLR